LALSAYFPMSLFAKKKSHKRPRSSEGADSSSMSASAGGRPHKERKSEPAAAAAAASTDVKDAEIEGDASGFDTDATFRSLGLCDWLQGTCSAMGFKRPTPVQKHCIPAILAGKVSSLHFYL
jgi:ATP-dependent RNA helicase DDX49/DBP8